MMGLEQDLGRWEAGDLPLAEVEARYPELDVAGLAEVHARLAGVLAEAPDGFASDRTWATILDRLPEPALPLRDRLLARKWAWQAVLRRRLARPLVAAVTAVLLIAGLAYAAGVSPVREGVDRVVRVVKDVFGDQQRPEPTRPASSPDDDSGPGGGNEDNSGPGNAEDRDERGEDADDDRSGPNPGEDGEDEEADEEEADDDRSGPSGDDDEEESDSAGPSESSGSSDEEPDDSSGSSESSGSGSPEEEEDRSGSNSGSD